MIWKIKKNEKINKNKKELAEQLGFSLHPSVVDLLWQRGLKDADSIKKFIYPNYEEGIADPFLFKDMKRALDRIAIAQEKKEKVLIFGDYDADGITSSLVLEKALQSIGIQTQIYIPHKEKDGYGINFAVLKKFFEKDFKLVISVDCGVTAVEEVKKAKKIGLDIIITDHHHPSAKTPNAVAVLNPKVENSGYPAKELAGVGVAFKLAQAIYEKFLPAEKEQLKWLLDLVAIGTVADMVPLLGENRTLVKFGLVVLSKTRRVGLQELFKVGRILIDENNFPDTQKISFQIAPRINAASRMSHAERALFLLAEDNRIKARDFALELEEQNIHRQKETVQIAKEAEALATDNFKNKKLIFVAKEHFPVGIIGLVAGRIANKFNKPTAILKKGESETTGSFRSIPQINIIELLGKCSELLVRFGGHAQAAGITIKNENLEKFYNKLNGLIKKEIGDEELIAKIDIDLELEIKNIDLVLVEDLKKMEPFGIGNKEPIFLVKKMLVQEVKLVGNGEKHLKLFLRPVDGSPKIFEAIGFSLAEKFADLKIDDEVEVVFNLGLDEWNGNKKIQMKIVDLRKNKNSVRG